MIKKKFKTSNTLFFSLLLIVLILLAVVFSSNKKNIHIVALKEVQHALVRVPPQPINPNNDLKPVYLNGLVMTNSTIRDDRLGISTKALSLYRKVYIYQWQETMSAEADKSVFNYGEDFSFGYKKVWSEHLYDSSQFHMQHGHINPKQTLLQSKKFYAKYSTIGDFILSDIGNAEIKYDEKIDLSTLDINFLKQQINETVGFITEDNMICSGSIKKPQIGDICIELYAAKSQTASVIAQQNGNILQPYFTRAGEPIFIIKSGSDDPNVLINLALAKYRETSWMSYFRHLFRKNTGF